MTEHEAILEIEKIMKPFASEDPTELDNIFRYQMTLEDIRGALFDLNSIIVRIEQILGKIDKEQES